MKTILCYGDSNTWGYTPNTGERFPSDVRWTGRLQTLLGEEYTVLEAGLSGRTTVWDDPYDPYLNGRDMLVPVMRMSAPLDLVILMLGTNDLKEKTAWDCAQACDTLIGMIQQNAHLFRDNKPNILWVAPPLIGEELTILMANPNSHCTREESQKFGVYYRQYAEFLKVPYFDAAAVAEVDPNGPGDGVHLGVTGHRNLADALAIEVKKII